MAKAFKYIKSLKFDQKPDYSKIVKLLKSIINAENSFSLSISSFSSFSSAEKNFQADYSDDISEDYLETPYDPSTDVSQEDNG